MAEASYPNEVQTVRAAAGLTRRQLAERAKTADGQPISPRSLERIERGEVQPREATAVAIARVLEKGVGELFPNGVADHHRNPNGVNQWAD